MLIEFLKKYSFKLIFLLCMLKNSFAFTTSDVATIINNYRTNNNLTYLNCLDEAANIASQKYAVELAKLGTLDHKDRHGNRSLDRYRKVENGSAMRVGEILAAGTNLEKIMNAWLHSPTHKVLIDDKRWTNMAVGLAKQNEVYVICVVFTNSVAKDINFNSSQHYIEFKLYDNNSHKEIIVYLNRTEFYRSANNKNSYKIDLPSDFKNGFITIVNQDKQGDEILF